MSTLDILAITLGVLAGVTLLAGLYLFVTGALAITVRGAVARSIAGASPEDAASGFLDEVKEIIKDAWKILFNAKKPAYERRMAAGVLLLALSMGFFLATAGVLAAKAQQDTGTGGTTSGTTTTSTTGTATSATSTSP